ncbi:MAG: hypothetical protein OEW08_11570 [Gammaproteobacteria bacterium]|nr:hypothetical protein [Gammaproteobacteria bacterium]
MLDSTGSVTSDIVKLALDTSVLRQTVYASNIANTSSAGFKPSEVSFERQMEMLAKVLTTSDDSQQASLIAGARALFTSGAMITPSADEHVQLDKEVAGVAENYVHYQALITGYGKYLAQLRTAIGGGQ